MNKSLLAVIIVIVALGGAFLVLTGNIVNENKGVKAIVYKSASCGCCEIHANYLKSKGFDVDKKNVQDTSSIKNQYGVPSGLQSCHTTIIGDYFVEGHMPIEAIEKLLSERPDIAGIAMPGMPSGSPGMPGTKYSDFVIYSIDHDGGYSEFMRI